MYTYSYLHVHTHIHRFATCLYLRATLFDVYVSYAYSQYCATLIYTKKHVYIRACKHVLYIRTCKHVFDIYICKRVHTCIHDFPRIFAILCDVEVPVMILWYICRDLFLNCQQVTFICTRKCQHFLMYACMCVFIRILYDVEIPCMIQC